MAVTESQALRILNEELRYGSARSSPASGVVLGMGDDCAVLGPIRGKTVWTVDACVEGSHFLNGWLSPEEIAHKSFHAAVSDVCAMGAQPKSAIIHLTLSPRITMAHLRRFVREQARLERDLGVAIIGGNLTFGPLFSVVSSIMGVARGKLLLRSGAEPNDEIWLCGEVGLARAGLLLKQNGYTGRGSNEQLCLRAFARPRAQFQLGSRLVGRARSCLDISDGLKRDAQNLADASGVELRIDETLLRRCLRPELVQVGKRLGHEPLQLAFDGGEDYALLATGPSSRRPRGARVIGTVHPGRGVSLGGGAVT